MSNNERTAVVVKAAMEKHGIEGQADDYTLAQMLPHGGEFRIIYLHNITMWNSLKLFRGLISFYST